MIFPYSDMIYLNLFRSLASAHFLLCFFLFFEYLRELFRSGHNAILILYLLSMNHEITVQCCNCKNNFTVVHIESISVYIASFINRRSFLFEAKAWKKSLAYHNILGDAQLHVRVNQWLALVWVSDTEWCHRGWRCALLDVCNTIENFVRA